MPTPVDVLKTAINCRLLQSDNQKTLIPGRGGQLGGVTIRAPGKGSAINFYYPSGKVTITGNSCAKNEIMGYVNSWTAERQPCSTLPSMADLMV